nr:TetR/AcrR family transcriptional regulator [Galbitalea soli]
MRNEPVQARSTARLTALLDAAAAAVDELGYERLTTAMVAERAGASIGTVYRYFPDRIAVLQALASRNLERVLTSVHEAISDPAATTWLAAVDGAFAAFVEAFRSEPGFASLRSGDVIDLRPAPLPTTFNSRVSDAILTMLSERFGIEKSADHLFALENAIEVSDALIARAFARDAAGDAAFLASARSIVRDILEKAFGPA